MSKRNRRCAERLRLLLDAGERLLVSLASVGGALEAEGQPWAAPSFKKVCAAFQKKFPEYPSLSDVEKSQGPEELQLKSRDMCEALEEKYLALHDAIDVRSEIWKLITELADDSTTGDCCHCFSIATGFLDLLRIYIQLSLLISQIPGKELLASFYAYCYQYATGFADTNFSRIAKLLHEQCGNLEMCWKSLRKEAIDIPSGITSTRRVSIADFTQRLLLGNPGQFGNNSILTLYQRFGSEALIEDDLLGLLSKMDAVQYPSGLGGSTQEEILYYQMPKIGSMKTWLALGYLLAPSCIYSHPRGVEGLQVVCNTGTIIDCKSLTVWTHVELYKIFHDKTFIAAYEASLEKKGFKDGKAAFKEAVSRFLAGAGEEHGRRREYLTRRISQIYHTLSDCPGLLGPHWGLVLSSLGLVREELVWYFQHRIPFPKDEKVFQKAKLDLGVNIADMAALSTCCLQLRTLAMRYLDTVSDYHLAYLKDVLSARMTEMMQQCESLDPQISEVLQSAILAVRGSSQGDAEALEGFRIDAERATVLALRRVGPSGTATGLPPNQANLMSVIAKSWHVCLSASQPLEALLAAASFERLWWYAAEFEQFLVQTMDASPANALVMVQIMDDFPRSGHVKLIRYLQDVGEKAMTLAEGALKRIAAKAVHLIRNQDGPSSMMLAELCRQAVLEMGTVRIFTKEYRPGEYLIEAIMADLSNFIRANLWHKDNLMPPSFVEQRVRSHVATLRVVEAYAGVPLQEIAEPVFAGLFVDTDGGQQIGSTLKLEEREQRFGKEAAKIGRWFLDQILRPKVYFVPFQQRFEGKHSELDRLTSPSELQALCRLIGPYGVRGVEKKMIQKCVECAQRVYSCISNNSYLLRALSAEDKSQFEIEKIQKLADLSQLHDMSKALVELGTILEFRKLLLKALGDVMEPTKIPESLRIALLNTNGPLRTKDTLALDTLAHDCGAATCLWPLDPALRTALTADGAPLCAANIIQGNWAHAVYALAAFVFSNSMADKDARYNPSRQAFRNNIHCAPAAILALAVLSQEAAASGNKSAADDEDAVVITEKNIQKTVSDLVSCTARLVVSILQSREARGKAKKDIDHIELIYLEQLMRTADSWCPNGAVRSAGLGEALGRSVHLWQLKARSSSTIDPFDDDDD